MIVSDFDLEHLLDSRRLFVDPLYADSIRQSGLDLHLAPEVARVVNHSEVYDVKEETGSEKWFKREEGLNFVINPDEKVLCRTVEYLEMPRNLTAFCYLRSTFARLGLFIPPTVVDAGFRGTLTIELFGSSFPVRLHSYDRFMHAIFLKTESPSDSVYTGKYQGQMLVTPPIMDRRENHGNV